MFYYSRIIFSGFPKQNSLVSMVDSKKTAKVKKNAVSSPRPTDTIYDISIISFP